MPLDNLVYGLVTAGTTMAGGLWVASRPPAWLTSQRLANMMSLGAGLLLAVVCFELLPAAVEHGGPHAFTAVFAGLLTVVLFERYLAPRLTFLSPAAPVVHDHGHDHDYDPPTAHDHGHDHGGHACHGSHEHEPAVSIAGVGPRPHVHNHDHHEGHGHLLSHGAACSALGCLLVCTFFDGVAMSAGFAVSLEIGLLLALGLIFHMLPEGLLASAVVLASGNSAALARKAAVATGLAFLLGMAVPPLLGSVTGTMAFAIPFAAGVLLYVVLGQLLPVAMRNVTGVPLVVVGALIFGLVERLVPHSH